jgi:hypothetical protein
MKQMGAQRPPRERWPALLGEGRLGAFHFAWMILGLALVYLASEHQRIQLRFDCVPPPAAQGADRDDAGH